MARLAARRNALRSTDGVTRRMRGLLLVVLLPAMLALCFRTPPFQVADEPAHYLRANGLSCGSILARDVVDDSGRPAAGGDVDRGAPDLVHDLAPRSITEWRPSSRATVVRLLRRHYPTGPAPAAYSNTAIYPPLLYLPDAAAIGLARAAGTTQLFGLYAGRVANVLAAVLCVFLLLGRAGRLAPFAICCASVPITLFSTASLSADALLAPVAIAFATLLALLPGTSPRARPLALALATMLLAVGKVAYVPLAAAPAFAALRLDRGWTPRARFLAVAGVIAVSCWAAWAWAVRADVFSIRPGIAIDPAGQARWIAAHPRWFAHVVKQQVAVQGRDLVLTAFGYRLGWANVPIPAWIGLASAAAILMSAAVVEAEEDPWLPSLSVAFLALAAACALGIVVLLDLQFNAVGAGAIDGIQGRYFLPLFIFSAPWLPRVRSRLAPVLREGAAMLSAGLSAAYLVGSGSGWWVA